LVKEAKKAGVRHIIKQSNILVTEMEPATKPYARLHREAEKIIDESGIHFYAEMQRLVLLMSVILQQ
jgi:uncharacterized protein YbjT (DUF2867 family)